MELQIMAETIETQARDELRRFEQVVTAVEKLCSIAASLQPDDMADYAYVAGYLGDELQRQFQDLHVTLSQRVLPFVGATKAVNLG